MYRKWKKTAALGLAVLIGGMMPMNTMLAAEDNTEVAQEIEADSVSDVDVVWDDEVISEGNGSVGDEENVNDEVNADDENTGDEANTDDVTADDEADSIDDQNAGIQVMSEPEETKANGEEVSENTAAPVIDIKFGDQSSCYALGGTIDYIYVNHKGTSFECSVKHNNQDIAFFYHLDRAEKVTDPAKDEGQLQNVSWLSWSEKYAMTMGLADEQNYVLYVKAEKDGKTTYARSGGVVVDTTVPKIGGVENGKTYPAGTTFTVSDTNLSEVLINGQKAAPLEDGNYKVATKENSTSCEIRAKDKAGNETVYSITVSGGEEPGTGGEEPGTGDEEPGTGDEEPGTGDEEPGTGEETPETNTVISASGVYVLKAGVKYHLSEGNWKIDGDRSVYPGGYDFYVKADGSYKFSK